MKTEVNQNPLEYEIEREAVVELRKHLSED